MVVMSFPRLLIIFALTLFSVIGIAAAVKSWRNSPTKQKTSNELAYVDPSFDEEAFQVESPEKKPVPQQINPAVLSPAPAPPRPDAPLPQVDRIREFFNKSDPKFPIVITVTYKSRVPWQKGRPAWLSDYASHYATSRHFIARSLNGKPDYFKQDVGEGDRFNVLNPDKKISFHLLIDTSRCKMWFYYLDQDTNERVLVKTYDVGLGRIDNTKVSGMLTPLGKYSLGSKVAIYKPKLTGFYNGQKVELIRIFGTRWIPFDKEIGDCTASPEGFGVHGLPLSLNEKGEMIENRESLGKYESDGCIRLSTADIEELFSIVITRPTTIELVRDYYDAELPGTERQN